MEMPEFDMTMRYESASIDLDSVDYRGLDRDDNTASLHSLFSKDKKKGHASKLMDYVCRIADMYNINLDLRAGWEKEDERSYSDEQRKELLSHDELISFYERKGFVFGGYRGDNYGVRKPIRKEIECEDSIKDFFEQIEKYYLELEEKFN